MNIFIRLSNKAEPFSYRMSSCTKIAAFCQNVTGFFWWFYRYRYIIFSRNSLKRLYKSDVLDYAYKRAPMGPKTISEVSSEQTRDGHWEKNWLKFNGSEDLIWKEKGYVLFATFVTNNWLYNCRSISKFVYGTEERERKQVSPNAAI